MNNSYNVAFYLRSATGNVTDLKKQQKQIQEKLDQLVLGKKAEIHIYLDQQQSGLKEGPDFLRLKNAVKNGSIEFVFVATLNRISRNSNITSQFLKLINQSQVRFISVRENMDSIQWGNFEVKNETI